MTRLSVNLNKIALLRNSRGADTPGVTEAARTVVELRRRGPKDVLDGSVRDARPLFARTRLVLLDAAGSDRGRRSCWYGQWQGRISHP